MTEQELWNAYTIWANDPTIDMPEPILLGDSDIFEDSLYIVNHLFFVVPKISSGLLRCFFFVEENKFSKDEYGDLHLMTSSFQLISNL